MNSNETNDIQLVPSEIDDGVNKGQLHNFHQQLLSFGAIKTAYHHLVQLSKKTSSYSFQDKLSQAVNDVSILGR